MKESPLHAVHARLGAKMAEFAGWNMPIQYEGILKEHHAVREAAGVFDISHMGQLFASGAGAETWLNHMLTNNVKRLATGEGQYTLLLNESGGVIDDLIVYRSDREVYLLVVNAARVDEDFNWLTAHVKGDVALENRSDRFGALAIQGPRAQEIFERMTNGIEAALPPRNGIARIETPDGEVIVCRTGYTGEDGFEWFCPVPSSQRWMERALEAGRDLGAMPCGLGARDTLRLEMGYPLNGSDLSPDRTPIQAGLGFFVDLEKGEFIGRKVLAEEKAAQTCDRLVGIRMQEKGPPPRPHYAVFAGEEKIGELTSGTLSPGLGVGIGMAYLPRMFSKPGTEVAVDIRGRRFPASVVKKPFISR